MTTIVPFVSRHSFLSTFSFIRLFVHSSLLLYHQLITHTLGSICCGCGPDNNNEESSKKLHLVFSLLWWDFMPIRESKWIIYVWILTIPNIITAPMSAAENSIVFVILLPYTGFYVNNSTFGPSLPTREPNDNYLRLRRAYVLGTMTPNWNVKRTLSQITYTHYHTLWKLQDPPSIQRWLL